MQRRLMVSSILTPGSDPESAENFLKKIKVSRIIVLTVVGCLVAALILYVVIRLA